MGCLGDGNEADIEVMNSVWWLKYFDSKDDLKGFKGG